MLTGDAIAPGDVILGLASSGVHQQRLLAGPADHRRATAGTRAQPLSEPAARRSATPCSTPTRIYVRSLLPLVQAGPDQGPGAHHRRRTAREYSAGSARWLPRRSSIRDAGSCRRSSRCSRHGGAIAAGEMARTFNCGIGMVGDRRRRPSADAVAAALEAAGETVHRDRRGRGRRARLHGQRRGRALGLRRGLDRTRHRWLTRARGRGPDFGPRQQHARADRAAPTAMRSCWSPRTSRTPRASTGRAARGMPTWTCDSQGRRPRAIRRRARPTRSTITTSARSRSPATCGMLSPDFIAPLAGRIVNIHPSLLPEISRPRHARPGASPPARRVTGCTVHLVTEELDAGAILAQAEVPVEPGDTPATLAARVLDGRASALSASALAEFVSAMTRSGVDAASAIDALRWITLGEAIAISRAGPVRRRPVARLEAATKRPSDCRPADRRPAPARRADAWRGVAPVEMARRSKSLPSSSYELIERGADGGTDRADALEPLRSSSAINVGKDRHSRVRIDARYVEAGSDTTASGHT